MPTTPTRPTTELRFPGLNHALQFSHSAADGVFPAPISPDAQADIHTWILGQK